MEPGSGESGAAKIADPVLRRAFGLDLDGEAWIGRMRDFCAEPTLGMLGPYELLATAGRGGQGLVFKARQPRTGRQVAIKRLAAGRFSTPDMRARFQREVEAVAALDHPHIVTVYGSEELNGEPVLVMRWIDGVPFDRWARPIEGVHRPVIEVLTAFVKVCDAVAHAHQRGIIHRDLKPSNVLVDDANEPHVLDFGLARRDDDSSDCPSLTLSGAVLGTPAYSPPEQLRGDVRNVDARSDVYSLGAMLYRALTGSTPVDSGLSHFAMAERIERVGPRSPAELNPELNREICSILQKALRGEPAERYDTVKALSEDIQRFLSGRPIAAHPPAAAYRLQKFVRRNRFVLSVAAVITIAVTVGVIQSLRMNTALNREAESRDDADRLDANHALDEMVSSAIKLAEQGKHSEAEALYRDVLARRRELVGDDHWSIIAVAGKLSELLFSGGQLQQAEPIQELALAACRRNHGPDHPITLDAALALIRTQILLAKYRDAEANCRNLPVDSEAARSKAADSWIFRPLLLQSRFAEAIAPMELALAFNRRRYGNAHRYVAGDLYMCGEMMRLSGDLTGAQTRFEEALSILVPLVERNRKASDMSDESKLTLGSTGCVLIRLGRLNEAEAALREVIEPGYPNSSLGQSRMGLALMGLGECHLLKGQVDVGEPMLIKGQGMMRSYAYLPARFLAVVALIEHYDATGRTADAAHWRDCLARRPFLEWLPPGASPAASTSFAPVEETTDQDDAARTDNVNNDPTSIPDGPNVAPDRAMLQALAAEAKDKFFNADYSGAEALYRQITELHRNNPGVRPFDARRAINQQFHSILIQERWGDALLAAEEGLRLIRSQVGARHRWAAHWQYAIGVAKARNGDSTGARAALEESRKIMNDLMAPEKLRVTGRKELQACQRALGATLVELGELDEAEATLRDASEPSKPGTEVVPPIYIGVARSYLGVCLFRKGKLDEAEAFLLDGQASIGQHPDFVAARLDAANSLINLYEQTGRTVEAEHWRTCIRSKPLRDWGPPGAVPTAPASSSFDSEYE